MIFSSLTFLFIFLPITLFIYYLPLQKMNQRNAFLLLVSLIFYAVGEPFHIFIMIFSICMNYRFGLSLEKAQGKEKNILISAIVANLALLFLFKYEGFLLENINAFTPLELESKGYVLPIGISFYTFQAMSYVIDVYRKKVTAQKSLLKLGLYIAFFPQLIAGPIIRYTTVNQQIDERKTTLEGFSQGIQLFLCGVGKKVIFANNFSVVSDYAFGLDPSELSVAMAWLGSICYSLQIFFDFSGYSDMAIGLALMFGFHFPKNFNYPYTASSVSDFWRRWHISLGAWFRDYLYIPLGGSRVATKERLVLNLLVVWLCTGIWHGASWKYLIWGLFYFALLTFEKITNLEKKLQKNPPPLKLAYKSLVLLCVNFAWVIFGEKDLEQGFYHIVSMLGRYGKEGNVFYDPMVTFHFGEIKVLLLVAVLACTPFFPWLDRKIKEKLSEHCCIVYDCLKSCALLLVLMVSVSYLAIGAHNPFIYFDF